MMISIHFFTSSSRAFCAVPAREQLVLVRFLERVCAAWAMLRVKRMVAKTCPIGNAIILHDQSVHVSTSCIILIVFDA